MIREAAAVIAENGVRSFSMREVARRLGVSHNAATYHFRNKDDVITAVGTSGFRLLAERLEEAAGVRESDGDTNVAVTAPEADTRETQAREALHRLGIAYFDFAVENPHYFRIMFGERLAELSPDAREFMRQNDRAVAALFTPVRRALEGAGEREVRDAALFLWSQVHGLARLHIDGPLQFRLSPEETVTEFVDAQLRACVRSVLDCG
ncbi:MAG: TetR family transcriptional regulator [Spirochaetes bacterium]|jgi:AcrR family transcriptional regulator|nr:TetR family transcriptional regulator [Spirochaetota bacterium]